MCRRFSILLLQRAQGAQSQVFPIYLSKYPDPFSNVAIRPVAYPLFMSKFFGSFNYFYSQNKSSRSDLSLEKLWVTQCGWLRLCTIVAMVITVNNFWKIFFYGVKRYHYEK